MKRIAKSFLFLAVPCLFVPMCLAEVQNETCEVRALPITAEVQATVSKDLAGCSPETKHFGAGINENNVFTLVGDLFHNRRTYCVIDDNADVIICEWQKSPANWKAVCVLKVQTAWNFPDGFREQVSRSPIDQPEPFWMIDLQGHPCLAIASDVEKAGQNYYVILLNTDCSQIQSYTWSFVRRPEVKCDYLLTGDCSRGKSEMEVTYYSRIQKDAFVQVASWGSWCPWHATRETRDDECYDFGGSNGHDYTIRQEMESSYSVALDEKTIQKPPTSFAKIQFISGNASDPDAESVYLFEKLTGLPPELYPENREGSGIAVHNWRVEVTGPDPQLIKLLSADSKQRK